MKVLKCVMLVDDNQDDNFYHERIIKNNDLATIVIAKNSARDALDYIKSDKYIIGTKPTLLFLDINMPGMNGWEFLEEYCKLNIELQKRLIIVMLTTSDRSEDVEKAKTYNVVSDYVVKPLTKEKMEAIIDKYFTDEEFCKTLIC